MDRDLAEVIWLFDVAADPDEGPVMCAVDEVAALVDHALAAAGCQDLAVEGVVTSAVSDDAGVRFDLGVTTKASDAAAVWRVVASPGVDLGDVRPGDRVRVWGWLRCRASGRVELEADRVDLRGV